MAESSETTEKWRYVIALGKFVVHMIYPGMTKAISVLVPAMVFQFQMNYTTVGFLVPMQLGLFYIACPLSNYLATKFGHRCVSSIGGFLSGVSMMGAFFCQSALSLGCSFFFTGFGIYGSTSSLYAYLAMKVKKENFPLAMATSFMTSGVILLTSATLAGNFFERIRSFKTIFIATGVVLLINFGVFSGFLFVDTFLKRRSSTENK
ncbi:monocarboxylate transporter 1-like isoform X2 [Lytechinus variegatus]|uniref:monocarboxylate transporter 1-like isoform X2 n=1 Tax=Lytechinus variegatus TaxID=7654 RepID=UPI001BB253B5|nr:monocarboxylate transporter 1-like isoform X2 [Lytechinus variegatus]